MSEVPSFAQFCSAQRILEMKRRHQKLVDGVAAGDPKSVLAAEALVRAAIEEARKHLAIADVCKDPTGDSPALRCVALLRSRAAALEATDLVRALYDLDREAA